MRVVCGFVFPKTRFSMVIPKVQEKLAGVESVMLFGIEVCLCCVECVFL